MIDLGLPVFEVYINGITLYIFYDDLSLAFHMPGRFIAVNVSRSLYICMAVYCSVL